MEERRRKMDEETKGRFESVTKSITDLTLTIEKDISYRKGLNIPKRVEDIETDVEDLDTKKASWNGLYLVAILIVAVISAVIAYGK